MIEIKSRNDVFRHFERSLGENENMMPALPQALVRVQKAIQDTGVSAKDLAEVILHDPSLTASVLRLANSAYYRHSRANIRTITSAIVLLGFETIRNLALGLSVYNMLNRLPRARNYRSIWRHSLCCAVCAQRFARCMDLPVPEEAFVAGLLHDMGKLILGQFFPEHYAQVLNASEKGKSLIGAENEVLKCSHLDAGMFIASYWSFPSDIVEAIGQHESGRGDPAPLSASPPLTKIVFIANRVAHFLFGDIGEARMPTYEELEEICGKSLGISAASVQRIINMLRPEIQDIARVMDIVIDDWRMEEEPHARESRDLRVPRGGDPSRERLEFLLYASELAASGTDFVDFLQSTTERLFAALGLEYVLLLFHHREIGGLTARMGYGPNIAEIRDRVNIRLDSADDPAALAFLEKKPVVVGPDNLHRFSRLSECNLVPLLGTFNIAAVPVLVGERAIAVLVAARNHQEEEIDQEALRILVSYCQNAATVLGRAKKRDGTEVLRRRLDGGA